MNEVSDSSRLLTCEQFRVVRDELQLKSMLERGDDLFNVSEQEWAKSRVYKKRMDAASKRDRPLIEADYNKAMAAWAESEADMGAIMNDARYKEWADSQHVKASGE